MGATNAGGGRTDAGPNRTTATKIGVGDINEKGKKTKSYKSTNPEAFRNTGAENIKKIAKKVPSPVLNILSIPLQHGSKVTRDFYVNKVLGSKNFKGQSKTSFLSMSKANQEKQYKSYISSRTAGNTDAYGNKIQQGDGGNNTPTVIKKNIGGNTIQTTAPTEAEVSQSEAANADAAALKVKKRGRSASIMTGPKGVTKTSTDYSLGKKSLLGRV